LIAGVNSAQVRKDLSHLGSTGVRGVGYHVADLREVLRRALGLTRGYAVVIIGAGNLGSALANYGGFGAWGFTVAAVLDGDQRKVGGRIGGHVIEGMDRLEDVVAGRDVTIGIIATPASAAQEVAVRLTEAGIRSILNFAPAVIQVPSWVEVRRVDLSTELQILTFHLQRLGAPG